MNDAKLPISGNAKIIGQDFSGLACAADAAHSIAMLTQALATPRIAAHLAAGSFLEIAAPSPKPTSRRMAAIAEMMNKA